MPNDITNVDTTAWASVTLAQNETWQVILGQIRLSLDTTPALEAMPLQSGLLLKAGERLQLTSGDVVRYRRVGYVTAANVDGVRLLTSTGNFDGSGSFVVVHNG